MKTDNILGKIFFKFFKKKNIKVNSRVQPYGINNIKNPSSSRAKGRASETIACQYLEKCGYKIIRRNYYTAHGELDIIAEDRDNIVFVEVKSMMSTTSQRQYGRPAAAVTATKKKWLRYSAGRFLRVYRTLKKPRFDIMEIVVDEKDVPGFVVANINHIQRAFSFR